MPRERFQQKIESLRRAVLSLGQDVRETVDASVVALRRAEVTSSDEVIARHRSLTERRWAIEGQTITAVAEQAPVASDCRRLLSFLAILGDLARIADHARGIGEIGRMMGPSSGPRRIGFLPSMADKALAMLDDALVALADDNAARARHVLIADDDLDRLQDRIYSDVFTAMIEDPSRVQELTYLLLVAHNLERVGDRSTNICEAVIFAVTGAREYADA
ncbi:MAG: phosphate transport system regulatory protein PhoU [Chloroflexi bacterium]|nr:phosphate transport system regulatory protein PhoU [Chloroflexota bacterium]